MAIDPESPLLAQLSVAFNGTHDGRKNDAANGIAENHNADKEISKNAITRTELFTELRQFDVDFKKFYGIEPAHVDRRFVIKLSELSYLPKVLSSYAFSTRSLIDS
jgi:hypothetical protein